MNIILLLFLTCTLLIPFIVSSLILMYLLRNWTKFGKDTGNVLIAGAVLGSGITCVSYAFELLVPDISLKMAFSFIRYIGNFIFLLSTLFYCFWFTNLWTRITNGIRVVICLLALLSLSAVATNSLHHLYYPEVSLVFYHGFPELYHTNGPLYYVVQIIALCFISLTIILFIRWKAQSPRAYGSAVILVFLAFLCPFFGYLLYFFGFRPFGFVNLTPFFMFLTSLLFAAAVFRYNFFSIKPIAHQMVIDSLPAGVILLDESMRIIEINPSANQLLGLSGHQLLGQLISDVFPEDDPIPGWCISHQEHQLQSHRDGRFLQLSLSSLEGNAHANLGFLLLITDITGEKEAQREIRKNAAIMKSTFDSIHDAILVVGIDHTVMAVNREFWRTWDFPEDLKETNDDRILMNHADQMVSTPGSFSAQVTALSIEESDDKRIITLKGGEILEQYSVPLFVDGSLIGRIWSFHDLTELKQREIALLESEARYRLIIENAADLIWTLTPEGLFSYVSPSWTRIIGYPVEETIGRDFRTFVHPEDILICEEYVARSVQSGERQPDPVYRVLHSDGTWHWHSAASVPVYDAEGRFVSLIGISRDITDKILANKALHQANRQLNLLSSITRHDILNLIMGALAYLDFSEDIPKDPRLAVNLEKLRIIVEEIQEQIEFTRVYETLGSQSPQWQQLDSLISTVRLPQEISCFVNCPEVSVYADPMMKKVFDNLFDNSVRHGESVTRIEIGCAFSPEYMTIRYEDDGVGIVSEDKNKIFARGFGKNTGLGLFLVREILSMTGISIRETGEPGRGVRFEIQVPASGYRRQ